MLIIGVQFLRLLLKIAESLTLGEDLPFTMPFARFKS